MKPQVIVMSAKVGRSRATISVTDLDGFLNAGPNECIMVSFDGEAFDSVFKGDLSDFRIEWVDRHEVGL